MQYKLNDTNISTEVFIRMIATMNSVAMSRFFEGMYCGIFEHLLTAGSKDRKLFGPISTYFGTVEINGRGMLYLYCLVWLYGVFHIT